MDTLTKWPSLCPYAPSLPPRHDKDGGGGGRCQYCLIMLMRGCLVEFSSVGFHFLYYRLRLFKICNVVIPTWNFKKDNIFVSLYFNLQSVTNFSRLLWCYITHAKVWSFYFPTIYNRSCPSQNTPGSASCWSRVIPPFFQWLTAQLVHAQMAPHVLMASSTLRVSAWMERQATDVNVSPYRCHNFAVFYQTTNDINLDGTRRSS